MRFMGGIGKFTGDGFNILARNAGNLLAPGRGIRFDFSAVFIFQPAIEAVIRQYQIINADHRTDSAIGERQIFHRKLAHQYRIMFYAAKVRIFNAAKVGEGHACDGVVLT